MQKQKNRLGLVYISLALATTGLTPLPVLAADTITAENVIVNFNIPPNLCQQH